MGIDKFKKAPNSKKQKAVKKLKGGPGHGISMNKTNNNVTSVNLTLGKKQDTEFSQGSFTPINNRRSINRLNTPELNRTSNTKHN